MKLQALIAGAFIVLVVAIAVLTVVDRATDPARSLTDAALSIVSKAHADLQAEQVQLERDQVRLRRLKLRKQADNLDYWLALKKYSVIACLSIAGMCALIVSGAVWRRKSVHTLTVKDASVPVRHADLKRIAPEVATGLVTAAALEARAPEKAFELWARIAEVNSRQIAALVGRRGIAGKLESPQAAALPDQIEPQAGAPVPTFREILDGLEPGGPMVLGFDPQGQPVQGGFDRIYSCGIFGLSGSGKTTGLYSIISQSLLLYPAIRYAVIDPHAGRKEGLTAGLPRTEHFTSLDPHDVRPGLTQFVQELDARLATDRDFSLAPRVLLIDELPVLMRSDQGAAIEAVLGRIAGEGRKVSVFALIAGQDTRLKAAGGNRDLLTSQIAYNLKKKQARYLFDDAEIVEMHKAVREAKEPGLCVFAPTDDRPVLMRQPLCTPQDVRHVTRRVVVNSTQNASEPLRTIQPRNVIETTQEPEETEETPFLAPVSELRERVNTEIETGQETLSGLAKTIGINKGQVYRFTKGEVPSEALHLALSKHYQKRAKRPWKQGETADDVDLLGDPATYQGE